MVKLSYLRRVRTDVHPAVVGDRDGVDVAYCGQQVAWPGGFDGANQLAVCTEKAGMSVDWQDSCHGADLTERLQRKASRASAEGF